MEHVYDITFEDSRWNQLNGAPADEFASLALADVPEALRATARIYVLTYFMPPTSYVPKITVTYETP